MPPAQTRITKPWKLLWYHVSGHSTLAASELPPPMIKGGPPMAFFSNDDPEAADKMRDLFGPGHVDRSVRQAIQMCWMMLPKDSKTIDELEKQFRRIVERAIKDLRDDADAFGLPK
jgi:hypothetical protein